MKISKQQSMKCLLIGQAFKTQHWNNCLMKPAFSNLLFPQLMFPFVEHLKKETVPTSFYNQVH